MGKDCCSPPGLDPESDATSLVPPSEKTSCCQGSRCDGQDSKDVKPLEKSDDCCSPTNEKCADSQVENLSDAPDCCRGKSSPCCDTSCLDRLAMRECESSATTGPGLNGEPNSKFTHSSEAFSEF